MNALPPLYGDARRWALVQADALELLSRFPDHSVDAVITDPPYGIGFNGQAWDGRDITATSTTGVAPGVAFEEWTHRWARECRRVLVPGGYLVAFGATRTVHRLAAGIEDAGFEVRDQLAWLYGSGVPKTGLRDGRSSTLKPGYEPIVLARAPHRPNRRGSLSGDGLLGIDEARIAEPGRPAGRWPANLLLGHHPRCTRRACSRACVQLAFHHRKLAVPEH